MKIAELSTGGDTTFVGWRLLTPPIGQSSYRTDCGSTWIMPSSTRSFESLVHRQVMSHQQVGLNIAACGVNACSLTDLSYASLDSASSHRRLLAVSEIAVPVLISRSFKFVTSSNGSDGVTWDITLICGLAGVLSTALPAASRVYQRDEGLIRLYKMSLLSWAIVRSLDGWSTWPVNVPYICFQVKLMVISGQQWSMIHYIEDYA